jgi:hypothetical protein
MYIHNPTLNKMFEAKKIDDFPNGPPSNGSHDRDTNEGRNGKAGVAEIAAMGVTAKAVMAGTNNCYGSIGSDYHIGIKVSGGEDISNNGSNDRNGSKGNKGRDCRGRSHNHNGSKGAATTGETAAAAAATTTGVTAAEAATKAPEAMNDHDGSSRSHDNSSEGSNSKAGVVSSAAMGATVMSAMGLGGILGKSDTSKNKLAGIL